MESLVDAGLARSIGVSNYSAPLMMDLERYARIMPATLQIEHHPYLRQKCEYKLSPYRRRKDQMLPSGLVGNVLTGFIVMFMQCSLTGAKNATFKSQPTPHSDRCPTAR